MLEPCLLYYYNHRFFQDSTWSPIPRSCQCSIIDNKNNLFKVKGVIFNIPTMTPAQCLELPQLYLQKPKGQIWAVFSQESAANYPVLDDPDFMSMFDYEITYRQSSQIWNPYLDEGVLKEIKNAQIKPKNKFCAAFISSNFNQSKRKQLLYKLMSYLPIDSYGDFMKNIILPEDEKNLPYSPERFQTKLKVIANYRFTLAFENSISPDYVTEKFFHPLMAGSVPVYFGARNIEEFSPGENAYINATDFTSVKELADFLETVDDQQYHHWRQKPIRQSFLDKVERAYSNPLDRLCELCAINL